MPTTLPESAFFRPLCPEGQDQGDPYILTVPDEVDGPYRYYVYATGQFPDRGTAFPLYGSNDLVSWQRLGEALKTDAKAAHWAPCVVYRPGLERPFVMLYSRSHDLKEGHAGHKIRRADSTTPGGPFEDSGEVLTDNLDWAIDPDVYYGQDGKLKLAFCMDFVQNPPLGTGIVETDIDDDLTQVSHQVRLLARPQYEWQVFDPARVMDWKTIPGVAKDDKVHWSTLEAPAGGLVSPQGQQVYLYSGGCFYGFYAVGALVGNERRLADVSNGAANFVIQPHPERGFYGPGHCSILRLGEDALYLMLHARFGSPQNPRQMCLAPLHWTDEGVPVTPLGANPPVMV